MEKIIIAVYKERQIAEEAFHQLLTIVSREQISLDDSEHSFKDRVADLSLPPITNNIFFETLLETVSFDQPLAGAYTGGFFQTIIHSDFKQEAAGSKDLHSREGHSVLTVETKESHAQPVLEILKRYFPIYLMEKSIS
ncbi:hypothetical protein CR194_11105 [Salipaludibacillus keqinensis]|uniref:Uncharacterized protein n=1 Tax=Salipaludibacillus keqinensis TaxID=2045207 RepID=A0A323TVX7_9BACI|nr:hypothetical protein [Salipaludibacillus keqinensis]PYZ93695.1 hypothetical protein CR194_11105 [Salipaludibacillus keqinensis]